MTGKFRFVAIMLLIVTAGLGVATLLWPGSKPGGTPARHAVSTPVPAVVTSAGPANIAPDTTTDPQAKIGITWIKPVGSEQEYAGNEACKTCHAREFTAHAASPHAHSLEEIPAGRERPEFASNQTITDPLIHVRYAVQKGEGKNQVIAFAGDRHIAAAAKWVFGSGTQAYTYMAQNGSRFGQLRMTYYPPTKEWNFTPGSGPGARLASPLGDGYTSVQAAACFGCHTTVLIGTTEALDLAHTRLGVGCESCHGPCRSHVNSMMPARSHAAITTTNTQAARSPVVPSAHTGPQIMQLCGQCHRVPVAVADEQAAVSRQLARFPGQALPRSRCFTESAGKLSCVTCHDAHLSTRQQGEASFTRSCLSCHTTPTGIPCTQKQQRDCVRCHMPAERIGRKLPLVFHNHWIRKNPGQDASAGSP